MALVKTNSNYDSVLKTLRSSFSKLVARVSEKETRQIADVIFQSMSHPHRYFHNSDHALEICDSEDPIIAIAGLFHDIVYLQVDEGLPPSLANSLASYVHVANETVTISKDLIEISPELEIVLDIFAVSPGDTLHLNKGLNEFLSSLAAHIYLKNHLSPAQLAEIHLCIEATIPFRIDEIPHADQLNQRANFCNEKYKLKLNAIEIDQSIQRAIQLANRDVKNFATRDLAWFLATTWLLLPERVPALRGESYTFADYRFGMTKIRDFFIFLQPSYIFKKYKGYPTQETFELQTLRATRNIELARDYLQIKIISIALLEAIAHATGGDLPINQMLGKVRTTQEEGERMEDYLSKIQPRSDLNPTLFSLLCDGRALETNFDLRNSPLAAFLYTHLSLSEVQKIDQRCKDFFEERISPNELLLLFPQEPVLEVIEACSKTCLPRKTRLIKLANEIRHFSLKAG